MEHEINLSIRTFFWVLKSSPTCQQSNFRIINSFNTSFSIYVIMFLRNCRGKIVGKYNTVHSQQGNTWWKLGKRWKGLLKSWWVNHEPLIRAKAPMMVVLWTSKSDLHLISPYNITTELHIKIMRMMKRITTQRGSWLLNKFILSAPWEIHTEQYWEYAYWCQGVKGQDSVLD